MRIENYAELLLAKGTSGLWLKREKGIRRAAGSEREFRDR
jgi:hypothetical protein